MDEQREKREMTDIIDRIYSLEPNGLGDHDDVPDELADAVDKGLEELDHLGQNNRTMELLAFAFRNELDALEDFHHSPWDWYSLAEDIATAIRDGRTLRAESQNNS